MHARGGTVFRKGERPHRLPSAKTVGEQTNFRSIFNGGFDRNGVAIRTPDGVGDRWHGRGAAGGGEDAAWVAPYEADGAAWLGEGGLNWLATTSKPGTKVVTDAHALKAGVDRRGKNATTPEQTPLHADSCWPNSHAAARAPWGDAHLVMITAIQDGTRLPYYPFDRGGQREITELNAGDVFVFRGDLVHVGAEYDSLNIRIHSYVDSPCAPEPRDADTTYHDPRALGFVADRAAVVPGQRRSCVAMRRPHVARASSRASMKASARRRRGAASAGPRWASAAEAAWAAAEA